MCLDIDGEIFSLCYLSLKEIVMLSVLVCDVMFTSSELLFKVTNFLVIVENFCLCKSNDSYDDIISFSFISSFLFFSYMNLRDWFI